ncbi:hypothetical protein ARMSODRAFT_963792 [Armillaria solidipes]|uniref:Uncharacterized protein n=1 Tax=Armillaria solidipes TaxID=1076256 RepID=A0A2H3B212_9AGAR|nr:hypothetical protein ARMSODRAFT_963792 [Armillaria solidipes]
MQSKDDLQVEIMLWFFPAFYAFPSFGKISPVNVNTARPSRAHLRCYMVVKWNSIIETKKNRGTKEVWAAK